MSAQPSTSRTGQADEFLDAVLRDEQPPWPENAGPEFARRMFSTAFAHGVHGLVWEKCHDTTRWREWPEPLRAELERAARLGAAADLLRAHRVAAALTQMRRHDVDALVLKGAALAQTHYSIPGMRARSDTDLFIRIEDIERVCDILSRSGFEIIPPVYKSHQFRAVSWQPDQTPITLDVHWRISNDPRYARFLGFEEAWSRSVQLGNVSEARTLCTADALMLACVHRKSSLREGRERLVWLYDIRLLVAKMTEQQMVHFAETAVARGVHDACVEGLLQASSRLKVELSDKVLESLSPGHPGRSGLTRFARSNLALLIDDFRRLPDMRSRRRLIGELIFPSAKLLMRRYGKESRWWLPWLYLRQTVSGVFKRLSLH